MRAFAANGPKGSIAYRARRRRARERRSALVKQPSPANPAGGTGDLKSFAVGCRGVLCRAGCGLGTDPLLARSGYSECNLGTLRC